MQSHRQLAALMKVWNGVNGIPDFCKQITSICGVVFGSSKPHPSLMLPKGPRIQKLLPHNWGWLEYLIMRFCIYLWNWLQPFTCCPYKCASRQDVKFFFFFFTKLQGIAILWTIKRSDPNFRLRGWRDQSQSRALLPLQKAWTGQPTPT